jgi:hypothetical protein
LHCRERHLVSVAQHVFYMCSRASLSPLLTAHSARWASRTKHIDASWSATVCPQLANVSGLTQRSRSDFSGRHLETEQRARALLAKPSDLRVSCAPVPDAVSLQAHMCKFNSWRRTRRHAYDHIYCAHYTIIYCPLHKGPTAGNAPTRTTARMRASNRFGSHSLRHRGQRNLAVTLKFGSPIGAAMQGAFVLRRRWACQPTSGHILRRGQHGGKGRRAGCLVHCMCALPMGNGCSMRGAMSVT